MKICFILFYLCVCINSELKKCNTIEPKIVREWFLWGQLYSYCMYLKDENDQQSNTKLFDENCSTSSCRECTVFCQSLDQFNLKKCLSDCNNSSSCKRGCRFYNNITTNAEREPIQVDYQNMPYLNSTSKLFFTWQQSLNVSIHWSHIFSKNMLVQSIYLVTVTGLDEAGGSLNEVLALVSENTFNLTKEILCKLSGNYITDFQVNVYPINYNSYNELTVLSADLTNWLNSSLSLSIFGPTYSMKSGNIGIVYNVEWTYTAGFEVYCYKLLLTPSFQCDYDTNTVLLNKKKLMLLSISNHPYLISNNSNITFPNGDTDQLYRCNLSVTAVPLIGECVLGNSITIKVLYKGCFSFPTYPINCIYPNTTTTPGPFIAIIIPKYNISGLYYLNERDFNFPYYDIALTWIEPISPFIIEQYKLAYFNVSSWSNTSQVFTNEVFEAEVAANTPFYKIKVPAGKFLNIYIFGWTNNQQFNDRNYRVLFASNYFTIKTSEVPTQTPSTRGNKTSTILVAVLVPLSVISVIFAFVVGALRLRKKEKKLKHQLWNTCHYSLDEYFESEKIADEWEISSQYITLGEKIGEGAYGTVFVCQVSSHCLIKTKYVLKKSKETLLNIMEQSTLNVAVKFLKEGANNAESNDFREEIDLMKGIGYHKNIVNMIGCSTIAKPLCLILEFMEYGNLLQFLRNRRNKLCVLNIDGKLTKNFVYTGKLIYSDENKETVEITTSANSTKRIMQNDDYMPNNISIDNDEAITTDDLLSFAWQVASGMEYLSSIKLVHRDLAARNVLVGAKKNLKISDFGLTRKLNEEQLYMSTQARRLPIKWMSIEAIFDQLFTSCSDVWAYGVVLFEIVTLGGTPYPTTNNRELLSLLKSGYRMGRPENCSDFMYDIMLHCWNNDPLQRPTFTELCEQFEGIMSQGDHYLTFDIDGNNICYNVASFNSLSSEIGNDLFEDEIFKKPLHVKSIEENKKVDDKSAIPVIDRYEDPKSLTSVCTSAPGVINLSFNDAKPDGVYKV